MEMDIVELVANMRAYEQVVMNEESSEHLTISTVQTLITLYQKAIEYYSAMDNDLYIDVRNRMQSMLARPDIEAIMNSAQESEAKQAQASSTQMSPAKDQKSYVPAEEVTFSIGDDEDEEEEEEEDEEEEDETEKVKDQSEEVKNVNEEEAKDQVEEAEDSRDKYDSTEETKNDGKD